MGSGQVEPAVGDFEPETGCLSFIVLGASGDLAKKKTFPAIFHLFRQGFLESRDTYIFGYARSEMSDDDLRNRIREYLTPCQRYEEIKEEDVSSFLELIKYVSGPYDAEEGFLLLDKEISVNEDRTEGSSRRLFYFALPPSVYPPVCKMIKSFCMSKWVAVFLCDSRSILQFSENSLSTTCKEKILAKPRNLRVPFPQSCVFGDNLKQKIKLLHSVITGPHSSTYEGHFVISPADRGGWTRIVVEKPFGRDLDSAEALSKQIGELFGESQIYRIDHYLGKELEQNLLVLRFANRLFTPLWNHDNISNVQIVFKEDFGTEGRGGYFNQFGIIRDILQNHLLQVLCLVAMEKPVSLKPEHIRDEKVKVLQSVLPINDEEVVIEQYEGYKDDPTVPDDSNTPTFATMVLRIHNERWEGVPFILKAGKSLNSKKAEIRVQFKDVPGDAFKSKKQGRNEFVIRLQPSEAIYLKLTVKEPGLEMNTTLSELDLSYRQRYQDVVIPEAYERLILDTIRGDQQHFVRRDELKAAWEIFTPFLHKIDKNEVQSIPYKPGSRGPEQADKLAEKVGYIHTHGYVWKPPTLKAV